MFCLAGEALAGEVQRARAYSRAAVMSTEGGHPQKRDREENQTDEQVGKKLRQNIGDANLGTEQVRGFRLFTLTVVSGTPSAWE